MHRLVFFLTLAWSPWLVCQPSVYHVNSADSFIHVYTGAEGVMQILSHRHLVAITDIEGELTLSDDGGYARLSFSPENFLVDNASERARAADPEFREPVSEKIQSGTRENMLGPRVLDSAHHPQISLDIRLDRLSSSPLLNVTIHMLGTEQKVQIPAILEIGEQHVWATGYFEVTHSQLGLEPYSALGGLMRVADKLRVQFELLASASEYNPQ